MSSSRLSILRTQRLGYFLRQAMNNSLWIWRSQIHDQVCCPRFDETLCYGACSAQVLWISKDLDGTLDSSGIPANGGAVAVKYFVLVAKLFDGAACEVPLRSSYPPARLVDKIRPPGAIRSGLL